MIPSAFQKLALAVGALWGCATQAPMSLTGRILDQPTGKAVGYATVLMLDSLGSTGTTSRQLAVASDCGRYVVPPLPSGSYRLRFLMVGWRASTQVVMIDSLRPDTLDVRLERVEGFEIHGEPIQDDRLKKPC